MRKKVRPGGWDRRKGAPVPPTHAPVYVHEFVSFCYFKGSKFHSLSLPRTHSRIQQVFTFNIFLLNFSDASYFSRRLLRFSVKIQNEGLADFRPIAPRSSWQWHKCHKHYHSMETFSSYDLISKFYQNNTKLTGPC